MPILKAEPDLFPGQLFSDEVRSTHRSAAWWVLHTRPRQEKSLARQLVDAELPFYLPLVARRSLIRRRVVNAFHPLFPGYLFLLVSRDEERIRALTTNRVVQSIRVPDQGTLWHDLSQIRRLIESGAPITPEDRLAPGMLVEIHSGPLAGLRGTILRGAARRRFVVQVDFIQRGASVELDDFTLVRAR